MVLARSRQHVTIAPGQIAVRGAFTQAGRFEQMEQTRMVRDAGFECEQPARRQMGRCARDDRAERGQPFLGRRKRDRRFERMHLGLGYSRFGCGQIGRVGDDRIERGPGRQGGVPIRADELHAGCEAGGRSVFPRQRQRFLARIDRGHLRRRESLREGQGNATAARAKIEDSRRRRDARLYDQLDQPLRLRPRTSARGRS